MILLSSFITTVKEPPNFFLFPSIIIFISAQFSRQGHRRGIWMGPVGKTERRNLNSGLSALSTSGVSLRRSLRAVVTLTNHTLWWEFSHVLPHIMGQMHGGKQQLHYGGSNKWRESWLLFIFFRCSSYCFHVCVYMCVSPWVRQVLIIQFPKSVTSSLFLGQGSPRVCHSVLGLSMGSLWGGCDDASGPVLVQVMTSDGFRKLQSLPLGGAIPSAASPEEAETLQHR